MRKLIEFGLTSKALMILITGILIVGGIFSFFSLGRLEDPPFSVKTALVITKYPGATPLEVEQEVTDRLETAIQQMPQVKNIYSMSREGLSYIKIDIKDRYWANALPQVWDELRRKISDTTSLLPPGVETPRVVDDFGFVFGFLLAITGEGFDYAELEDIAEKIQKQIYLVPNIARIDLWGIQQRAIHLDVSNRKLSELRISPQTIYNILNKQNMVVDAGYVDQGNIRYPMHISGEFKTPNEIRELIIQPQTNDLFQNALLEEKTKKVGSESFVQAVSENSFNKFSLGDVAKISVGYVDPPTQIMKFNGMPAIGMQIAGAEDSNIVEVGTLIDKKLQHVQSTLPIGVEIHKISWQSEIVQESVLSFVISMIESIAIVLIVLLIPSGLRMGGIIGFGLILTILATLLYMYFMNIPLERMSLGALIIAMGMMVDNSIVVADGIGVNLRKGMNPIQAAISAAATPALPLLFATIIAVMSFYPIYASEGSTGEYCRTLFVIVGVSLTISWFIAMLMTPQHCIWWLSSKNQKNQSDEFDKPFFNYFRKLISVIVHHRLISVCLLVVLLVISVIGFKFVIKLFFPFSTRPQLMVDYWAPAGTTIQEVSTKTGLIEKHFLKAKEVESVSSFIGAGPPRFYLPVDPEFIFPNYGQLLVNFKNYQSIDPFIAQHGEWLHNEFPEALIRIRKFNVGPGDPWKFELRILGPPDANLTELRKIGSGLLKDIYKSPLGTDWRLDMMNPIRDLHFDYDQQRARSANISRHNIANALERSYDGLPIGLYREKNKLYQIQWRNTADERKTLFSHLDTLPVRAENGVYSVPLAQTIYSSAFKWEEPYILRWDRQRQVAIQGSPILTSTFADLKKSVAKDIEHYPLGENYTLFWDGEEYSSTTAQKQLLPGIVPTVIVILLCLVATFKDFRPIAIILLTIPFAFIGITAGLLFFHVPFGFMALLGAMSLAGMMNKNIVVLLDACNENIANGMDPYHAIIEAAVRRARPVMLAAGTTILGVIPLLQDIFWTGLGVAIMGGLTIGSLLTLIAVPLFYVIIYRIHPPPEGQTMMAKSPILLSLLLFTGCLRVGPNFKPPVTQIEDTWTEASDVIKNEEIITPAWWLFFEDTTLNALIDYAMHENYTLEAAVDRIAAARANLGIAIGEQYPQTFQLEGSALRTHLSENAPNTANINRNYWDLILGLRVAWEIDFWGRFYRGVEAACGEYRGAIDDFENIKRLIISDIVLAYVELKTIFKRISILDKNIAIQHRSFQITEARYESGYESQLDNAQAGALWKQTESLKEVLEIEKKRFTTTLAVLLGLTPEAFACLFPIDPEFIHIPKEAITGFPAQVLCRRPDLRRSLDLLFAQNARVGIAISDLYPRISFTGFLGFESTGKNFFSTSSLTFFYGPSVVWPFFSFGRIENHIREQYALLYEGIALYRNQVLVAYKEVEDALTFFAKSIQETNKLEEGFAFAKRSVDISTLQYQEGIADYSRVLNSLQLQVNLEDQMAQAQGNIGLGLANIYRALGVF